MKNVFSVITTLLDTISIYAHTDVTKFLGIPVDGSKAEMIEKIKSKGFIPNPYGKDILTGIFNGTEVNIHIGTNGDKVCRIMVCDANNVDGRSIRIRFNNLCRQFENSPNYVSFEDYSIPDDEDISYCMSVENKQYQAIFYQQSEESTDTAVMRDKLLHFITTKFTPEQLEKPTDDMRKSIVNLSLDYIVDIYLKKPVWFIISEMNDKYYIAMFYDNEYNKANGEDL